MPALPLRSLSILQQQFLVPIVDDHASVLWAASGSRGLEPLINLSSFRFNLCRASSTQDLAHRHTIPGQSAFIGSNVHSLLQESTQSAFCYSSLS
jgi:hypothetical protein